MVCAQDPAGRGLSRFGSRLPRVDDPDPTRGRRGAGERQHTASPGFSPVRVFWFSGPAWSEGIEVHPVDDTPVRIYGPEKSVADAFKFRRKLGLDLAIEALKAYRRRPDFDVDRLLHYADVCRVEQIMSPYLETLL
jgi:hypothetical protein